MRRCILFLLILAFMPVQILEAKQIDASSALERALRNDGRRRAPSRIVGDGGDRFTLVPRINAASRAPESGNVYVFNHGDDGGYIVVSGDDEFTPVLAYADSGSFDWSDIPTGMKYMLEMYEAEISAFRGRLSRTSGKSVEFPEIEPLVSAKWGQGRPYNLKVPKWGYDDAGNRVQAVTGCVATAMAQVMHYHQWPQDGKFDWNNMLPEYIEGNYTEVQADAVATLMAACGAAVDMDYGVTASGANTGTLPKVFPEIFNYEKSTIRIVFRDNITLDSITGILVGELTEKRPVIVSAFTKKDGGHSFVLDGCNSDGYFHINWGWNGLSDGYFLISALAPDGGCGTGGSTEMYDYRQEFLVGLQKVLPIPGDYSEEGMEVIATGDIHYEHEHWIVKNGRTYGDGRTYNGFVDNLKNAETLELGCKFVDKENGKIFYEWSSNTLKGWKGYILGYLSCNLPASYTKMTGKDIPVPAGSYDVYPMLRVKDSERIIEVKAPLGMKQCIEMVIYEDKPAVIIDEPKESGLKVVGVSLPEALHQGDLLAMKFNVKNSADDYYLGDISIRLRNVDAEESKEIDFIMTELAPHGSGALQCEVEIGVDYENGNYRFVFTDLRGKIIGESEIFALVGIDHTKMITVDDTNFPDPGFRSWVQSKKLDANNDGYLSEKERRVKNIELYAYGDITDLKGVELFPEVEWLMARGSFTEANLENCPNLELIMLQGQLETMKLGEMPGLETLDLQGNSLKTLNLEKYHNLKDIRVNNNKLETIILGEKPNLEILDVSKNNLEELDVEKCTELRSLDLLFNSLRSINIGHKPYLEQFWVQNQNLEHIDLENCPALKRIILDDNKLESLVLGEKPQLELLRAHGNNLEELDLAKCPALKTVYLYENKLQSLDFSNKPLLNEINIYNNRLTELILENLPELSSVVFNNNQVSRFVVKECPKLKEVEGFHNEIVEHEIKGCPEIEDLKLEGNKIENVDLKGLPKLEKLYLAGNRLRNIDVSANSKLSYLSVSSNMLTNIDLSGNPDLKFFAGGSNFEVETDEDGSFDLTQFCKYGFDFNKFIPDAWDKGNLDETGTKIVKGSGFGYGYLHGSPNSDIIGDRTYVYLVLKPKNPSGIDDVMDDRMTFAVSAGTVEFINKPADDVVEIYNISGHRLYRGCEATVSGLASGIYIAKVGGKAIKIFVP